MNSELELHRYSNDEALRLTMSCMLARAEGERQMGCSCTEMWLGPMRMSFMRGYVPDISIQHESTCPRFKEGKIKRSIRQLKKIKYAIAYLLVDEENSKF